ncbi:MAG: hypothetical protein COB96_03100 [Planctomycetota bacterium]|nr:MAG: hypothetical protein COB96_03100 [Planctomycetota bacterium]
MELILDLLSQNPGLWAFGLLVLCGLGLPPWSEEIIILCSGYFVATGELDYEHAVGWCWLGILAGDSLIYILGRTVGERVYDWPLLSRHMGTKQRARFNRRFRNEGTKAVFIARFIPGFRMVAYFVAGNLRMNYFRFLVIDSIGAVLTVPISVWLGKVFYDNLDAGIGLIREFEIPLAIAGGLVLVFLLWNSGRRRRIRLRHLLNLRSRRHQIKPPRESLDRPSDDEDGSSPS